MGQGCFQRPQLKGQSPVYGAANPHKASRTQLSKYTRLPPCMLISIYACRVTQIVASMHLVLFSFQRGSIEEVKFNTQACKTQARTVQCDKFASEIYGAKCCCNINACVVHCSPEVHGSKHKIGTTSLMSTLTLQLQGAVRSQQKAAKLWLMT